ncbi:MAG: site-2 protease family protein [Alphaproteobacteria bacterium]
MQNLLSNIAFGLSVWALPVLIAVTFHEAAHGYVAWRCGDDTAYKLGRVTFNPLKHVDRFGTVILPALLLLARAPFLFGWAKPVPVNFSRLQHPRRDMVLVAAAGPATNLILALLSAFLLHVAVRMPAPVAAWAAVNLQNSLFINVVLAIFNMLPLPPLDGGRVAVGLLPRALARPLARLERWGLFILVGLLFILPMVSARLGFEIDVLDWLIGGTVRFVLAVIATLAGLT